jgi:hypothetical protein
MTLAFFIPGSIFVILVLWSRLHEARENLARALHERDAYARQVQQALVTVGLLTGQMDGPEQ